MSKLTGITKAAELLQEYISEVDAKLDKQRDNCERSLLIGRKLGAIEYFEKMSGSTLAESLRGLRDMRKQIGNTQP